MSLVWIVLGILVYIGLAMALGRFVGGRGLARLRDEMLRDGLPSSATGNRDRNPLTGPGRLEWTEVTNLSVVHGRSRPISPNPARGGAPALVPDPAPVAETVSAGAEGAHAPRS